MVRRGSSDVPDAQCSMSILRSANISVTCSSRLIMGLIMIGESLGMEEAARESLVVYLQMILNIVWRAE